MKGDARSRPGASHRAAELRELDERNAALTDEQVKAALTDD